MNGQRPPIGGGDSAPWIVLGIGGLLVGGLGIIWLGGSLAALAVGHGWNPPAFGTRFAGDLVRHQSAMLWPGTPGQIVVGVSVGLAVASLALVSIGVAVWHRRQPVPGDPLPSLATPNDVFSLTPQAVLTRSRRLRPSLAAVKKPAPRQTGLPLGDLLTTRGPAVPLRASWEDVLLAVMAPRAGKTTALAVPAVVEAPGPVVATSNKADLWAVTSATRSTTGRVWTFDPQRIAHHTQDWWWNPLAEVRTVDDAHRLAQHFVLARADRGGSSGSDFWEKAAQELLTALLLAAGCSSGSLHDVYEWLTDSSTRTPATALERAGHLPVALSLRGMQTGATETREGIYQTARTAAQAMRDPAILRWVTPGASGLPAFRPQLFVDSRDTLYLLSKDGAGSAAPLVAALTDAVFRAGVAAAEMAGGRLDPPLVAVLDEAANICRIADLPDLYSHLGSRGVIPVTILQSYKQGVRVWGDAGMDALWSAATVKVIGAGIDDAKTAEDLSRLIGDHDVATTSTSRSRDGWSHSTNQRRQRILGPEDIRALPRGRALLLATGSRAAMLRLRPWYDGPAAPSLESDRVAADLLLRERASKRTEAA